ncbi:DNA polymerase delta catalytic subunit-like protein [Leptotrombidium deliense]|uniref:DNA polymerase n=1 Tax=Leptotrombidium deliense TaxID=299467 RepID=A0A443S6M5_9ACAR|nr:DNA polymerase delta catalytic subunit-like protein [Leptotrombidium deliense]
MDKWMRAESITTANCFVFQHLELDYYISAEYPVVRIYGINERGNSVLVHVHGFHPYFYILPPLYLNNSHLSEFKESLNLLMKKKHYNQLQTSDAIINVEFIEKQNIYGYQGSNRFLKITTSTPDLIWAVSRVFQGNYFTKFSRETYESNIDYKIRFMVDTSIVGCCWIRVDNCTFRYDQQKQSHCQIECDVRYSDITALAPEEGEWSKIAPFRILSFDIEVAGRKGIFPEPEHDPVIQISNCIMFHGETEPFVKCLFTLKSCAPITGATIFSYETEEDLLSAWSAFITKTDPDIITGYNILNFDFTYLLKRAARLQVSRFPFFGRIKHAATSMETKSFQSKQMGNRNFSDIKISGRCPFDLFQVVLRDYKLRSYSLNAVSYHFLEEQKEDVHYSIITDLQNGDENTRRRLAVYCLKDAVLPLRLLDKLMCIINYMEMARVTGVPLNYLLTRGQQVKVTAQLMKFAKQSNFILPTTDYNKQKFGDPLSYTGATVIEPMKGYYDVPIATLDFCSLYPSIMIAHNLCYTTLVTNTSLINESLVKTPSGSFFVKPHVRKGLLPQILEHLIETRKAVKQMLKREKDPFKIKVLDGRQYALKVSANSVYGFTGAQNGILPCLAISESVTAFGRQMIEMTKYAVEQQFKLENGYPADAVVIYGDTDSVMVKFGVSNVADAMKLGNEAAKFVSTQFIAPIKLEFEKVYFPYLLINKKRYAGLYYSNAVAFDKMDTKGIETVRRDNCPLVSKLITTCLKKLLIDKNPDEAIAYTQRIISDLLCDKIDIADLIISKEYSKEADSYAAKQAHVELVKKLIARDPGSAPKLGERVQYVIITGPKRAPAYTKAEDPIYVMDHCLPIDTDYYLNNQLIKPLLRIFEPIYGPEKAKSLLLYGEHTRRKTVTTVVDGPLSKFMVQRERCLNCKSLLPINSKAAVCDRTECHLHQPELFQTEMCKLQELELLFNKLWTQCQRCTGNLHENVICSSRDCPIFYKRKKTTIDLSKQQQTINKFGIPSW